MMHPFGMMFPWAWILVPVLLIILFRGVIGRLFFRSGNGSNDRTSIREAPEAEIFRIAREHGGRLTVSDLVIESGFTVKSAEQALQKICDNAHVRMDVTDSGSILYVFPEIAKEE